MARLATFLLVLAFVAFGLFFGTLNEQPVEVDFFFFTLNWPLALMIMSAFLAGVLLSGSLVYLSMWFGVRRRIREMKKAQVRAEAGKALSAGHG
ncbi:MAG: LapA family protein [Pseudomonadota bacterium]